MPNNMATILIVDDQESSRFILQEQIAEAGFSALAAPGVEEALAIMQQRQIDLVLSDLVMPGIDGLAFLAILREKFSSVPFVVITSHASIASAVGAIKQGAFDYVEKHCSVDELCITIKRALKYQLAVTQNEQFKQSLQQEYSFENIVTVSPVMKQSLKLAVHVTGSPATTVLLMGESGCGKEVLARAIHFSGGGMPANFVGVNCAAIPENLLESELFGHVRGSFTGAERDREGKFALAKDGTILLDEIGDMPLDLQAKLLRVLEERQFMKVGSNQPVTIDCRIIFATNNNLRQLVDNGRFREDLFHRINVFPINIPPLRDRREDISILTGHFMSMLRRQLGKQLPGISEEATTRMIGYNWLGNIRELRNCLERAAIIAQDGELIRAEHLSIFHTAANSAQPLFKTCSIPAEQTPDDRINYQLSFHQDEISLDAATDRILEITLKRCNGNKSKAADLLKVNRQRFYRLCLQR